MKSIVTLTLNPSIDVQYDVRDMVPVAKIRASTPLQFPGGGGINVSRVIKTLGARSIAIHTAGWLSGQFFREMVENLGLLTRTIPIQDKTRTSATIYEESTHQEYRITPKGPDLTEAEWRLCLDAVTEYDPDFFVLTGSLPGGVPQDFYAQVAKAAQETGTKVILDTSGRALFESLKAGVYLVKPNQRELEGLVGRKARTHEDQVSICRQIIDEGKAEVVALTLGAEGALLVSKDETIRMDTPKVEVVSAVGAGDSFVGGLVTGLACDMSLRDAFALANACGTAAVLTAGTSLCRRDDIERMFEEMTGKPLASAFTRPTRRARRVEA